MTHSTRPFHAWGASLLGAVLVGAAGSNAIAADAIIVTGANVEYGRSFAMGPGGGDSFPLSEVCSGSPAYAERLQLLLDHTDSVLGEATSTALLAAPQAGTRGPNGYDGTRDAAVARESLCADVDPRATVEPFVIAYAECRMGMYSPVDSMLINLAASEDNITMYAADHQSREIMQIALTPELGQATAGITRQWDDMVDMRREGGRSEHLGYPTERFTFESRSGSSASPGMGGMMSVSVEGFAYVAAGAPGGDTVQAFYRNLSRSAPPSEGSMIDNMLRNMVGILREGMPLYSETTTVSTMMGRAQAPQRSASVVTGLRERPLSWNDCGVPLTPAGYRVTDMAEQLSQALNGQSMDGMPSDAEIADAMRQYEEAMAGMSQEERDLLAQFTGANGFPQATAGGAAPPAAPPMPATAAASGMAAAGSANLMGASVEESVTNHLKALGYDTGSGELEALYTSIAISQFQELRGMPVTGEASPQVLGALAAAVEERR